MSSSNAERDWERLRGGLAWTIFSPLLLLIAVVSKTPSDIEFGVTFAFCGVWSVLGVISGIGRLAGASWAERLQERLTVSVLIVFLIGLVVSGYHMWKPLL